MGVALIARTDELSAASDKTVRFRLKRPFALLPTALSQYSSAIMPERLAKTDPFQQIPEPIGSGPFRFNMQARVSGALAVFERFEGYVPRPDGVPSFTAGPKIAHFNRVEWQTPPDPATCAAALANKEVDWWENPTIDLIPRIKRDKSVTVRVIDITGEIGCLRFNELFPPFDNPAIRRAVLAACNQNDFMQAVAGAVPDLIKTDVGIFVPGTVYASDVGITAAHGSTDYAKLKADISAAGYKGEKVVLLGATSIPAIHAISEVTADVLTKLGFNLDYQALEWGTVVARRASKEPIDKGGWSVFLTYLGGAGNVTPAVSPGIRGNGAGAWFGWPTDAKMESLRDAWFEAPNLAAQQALCRQMQEQFWQAAPYVPLGMYDAPTAYHNELTDIRDGFPQMYGVKRAG
jgi:peptide/nickel transport system substrate-binding protein